MKRSLYDQTGNLIRFILRRDRFIIPVWLLSLLFVTLATAVSFTDLFSTEMERQAMAETMRNPAMTAMIGPGYGLDNYTYGAMMAHQMLLFTAMAVGLMNIFFIVRHTRADEEDGRMELIRSLPVGRLSHLHASMITSVGINIVLALSIGFGLYALKIESMDLQGSLLYGVALGSAGLFFAAVSAVFVQWSENTRGAIGFSIAALMLSYLIRAIGDVSVEALSWISPFGWVTGTQVYVNNDWWPVILTVLVSGLILILAYYLNSIRDLGAGFLATKPGKRHASVFLLDPIGLNVRLLRTGIISWAVGLWFIGASYGSVFGDLEAFFVENAFLADLISMTEGFTITDQFVAMLMSVMAMISTVPALIAMLRIISEERKHRMEPLLSLAVSRSRYLGSALIVSIAVSIVMIVMAVLGLWFAAAAVMDDGLELGRLFGSAFVYLPAMWTMIGIAVFLIGIWPRFTVLTWLYLIYSFVVVYLGQLLQMPEWIGLLSPFGHVPQIPVDDMNWMRVSVLTLLAIVFSAIGFIGYNKRDIQGG